VRIIGGIVKKLLILSAIVLGLGACSSAEKKDMKDAGDEAQATAEQTKENMEEKAEEAKEEAESSMEGSKASCTLDKDTRVIEVKKTDGGGCELFYTKFGESKSVASSGFGTQYCEEVKDRIQSNLSKAGFTCQ
jgi:hypothetical protein